jgi:hypothetical protein
LHPFYKLECSSFSLLWLLLLVRLFETSTTSLGTAVGGARTAVARFGVAHAPFVKWRVIRPIMTPIRPVAAPKQAFCRDPLKLFDDEVEMNVCMSCMNLYMKPKLEFAETSWKAQVVS